MAPSDDFFEKGSLYKADVNVIGAGGGLKLNERGTLRYPTESDNHGISKYGEKDSIKNKNCPYVLIAIGRASFQMGASMYMRCPPVAAMAPSPSVAASPSPCITARYSRCGHLDTSFSRHRLPRSS